MRLATQVRTAYLVLVGIQVLTSLAGIALLARMSPALGQVLAANEATVADAELMLAALATSPSPEASRRFEAALRRAEDAASDPAERELVSRLEALQGPTLAGEPEARATTVSLLIQLSEMNRHAMHEADARVRQLGLAGRWALVLLGLLALLASALAMRRAGRQLVAPVTELVAVLEARRGGDRHRRYTLGGEEGELARVLADVNEVLDAAEAPEPGERGDGLVREALVALLDARGGASIVVGEDGEIVAASREALDRLAERDEPIRAALRAGELAREPLGRLSLVRLP